MHPQNKQKAAKRSVAETTLNERWIEDFKERWIEDQKLWLQAARVNLAPNGRVAIVVGDGAGVDTLAATLEAAEKAGLTIAATATISPNQEVKTLRAIGNRRTEHAILLVNP